MFVAAVSRDRERGKGSTSEGLEVERKGIRTGLRIGDGNRNRNEWGRLRGGNRDAFYSLH